MAPISFGIELEFNLAYLEDQKKPSTTETRQLRFTKVRGSDYQERIQKDVTALLDANGFPVNQADPAGVTMKQWQVSFDGSLSGPIRGEPDFDPDYKYAPMEVKTPALEFNKGNLDKVEQVCDLFKKTYVVSNNNSTGLHVHTGRFSAPVPFSFNFLKKLITFLYVMDPQISCLHTADRIGNPMIGSIRDRSRATIHFQREFGYRPLPATVVPIFMAAENIDDLLRLASESGSEKWADYNFLGLRRAAAAKARGQSTDGEGHTIEFRQHTGTLDGQAICMWVRVLAGILNFIDDVSPEDFTNLIGSLMVAETWEKEYDGKDNERARKYGPVPADGSFTVIDLLKHIGLHEEAEYYKDKWTIHTRKIARVLEPQQYKEEPERDAEEESEDEDDENDDEDEDEGEDEDEKTEEANALRDRRRTKPPRAKPPIVKWDFLKMKDKKSQEYKNGEEYKKSEEYKKAEEYKKSEEYLDKLRMKSIWKEMKVLEKIQGSTFSYWDPNASYWPKHSI